MIPIKSYTGGIKMNSQSLKIVFFSADSGDCFLLVFNNGDMQTTLLIDGGYRTRYLTKLKNQLLEVYAHENSSNYIFLTHIDNDHIGGIQAIFEDLTFPRQKITSIIFNTTSAIKELTPEAMEEPPIIEIMDSYLTNTSYVSGISLEQKMKEYDVKVISGIIALSGLKLKDINITFLSPRIETMKKYKTWIEKEEKRTLTATRSNDYNETLEYLKDKIFEEDTSITNASSLSMIIEYMGKRLLFLGDSIPSDIVASLKELGYSRENKLILDLVKVSHHGSRKNTSNELLNCIVCDNFLISTDGTKHEHPSKETLARIINSQSNPTLIFNYDLIKTIFSKEELDSLAFKTLLEKEVTII